METTRLKRFAFVIQNSPVCGKINAVFYKTFTIPFNTAVIG